MKPLGDLYTTPPSNPDGPDPAPQLLHRAFSLAGARRGEVVPVGAAEMRAPASQSELSTPWGRFRRLRVVNRGVMDHQAYREEIEVWQRV